MRYGTRSIRFLLASTVTWGGLGLGLDRAVADNPAGHAIADRFAQDGAKPAPAQVPTKRKPEPTARQSLQPPSSRGQPTAAQPAHAMTTLPAPDRDEQEMLARARAEAEHRRIEHLDEERAAAEARDEEIRRQAIEADRLRAEARRAEEERARIAEQEKRDLEIALQKKAAEELERLAELERRRVEESRRADELAETQRREAEQLARHAQQQQRQAEDSARIEREKAEQARLLALSAERAEEGRRITEKLKQAEAARAARDQQRASAPPVEPRITASHTPTSAPETASAPATQPVTVEPSGRYTVLLVMEPGNRGIRRRNKTADPVLCGESGCWISSGPQAAAHLMHPGRALGFSRTWGDRAGACSGSLGCVFRGVELGARPGWLQPVDMRLMRHDRREPKRIEGASTCRIITSRLQCGHSYEGSDYVMWVVPESIAEAAGPALLQRALTEGLPEAGHAALPPSQVSR